MKQGMICIHPVEEKHSCLFVSGRGQFKKHSIGSILFIAAAEENHVHTVENRQIQAHTVSVCEIMEGSDGNADSFVKYLPGGISDSSSVNWYYDRSWNICCRNFVAI